MPRRINLCVFLRLAVGGLFIISGFEKLISPYQNFLYVIQSYDLLPPFLEEVTARIWPWTEFFIGIFLTLGLWLRWSLYGLMGVLVVFIFVVTQALFRRLPIDECGCFGDLISFPLSVVIVFDAALLAATGFLYYRIQETVHFSLDRYLSANDRP